MPDFATPIDGSSVAHAHLAAAVRDPIDGFPVRLVAVAWFPRFGRLRLVVIRPAAELFTIQTDRWWGRVSRHVAVLDRISGHGEHPAAFDGAAGRGPTQTDR